MSCTPQNQRADGAPLAGDLVEEPPVAERPSVLDVLLPLGGDLAHQVAHRHDDVDLAVGPERLDRARDLRPGGRREDLVGDDHGAVPVPDLCGEPVPGSDGLPLEPAPGQLHEVERGEEVGVEAVRGVEHAVAGQLLAVLEQHVLHEGRARLRRPHVHEHGARGTGC